jgi:16S rRNA (cytosine967-C5)-methyltransferase
VLDRAADIAVVSAAATRLFRRGIEAERPLDAIVSTFIRDDLKGAPRPLRGEVARLAQAMWRRRRLLEAIDLAVSTGAGGKGAPGRHRDAVAFAALVLLARDAGRPVPALPLTAPECAALVRVVDDVVKRSTLDVRASLPPWLCERLVQLGGEELALASTATPPQTLRVNTLKTTREALLVTLRQQGLKVRPSERSPVGIVTDGEADIFRTPAFFDGTFEMQDEGSQLVALHAAARPGERPYGAHLPASHRCPCAQHTPPQRSAPAAHASSHRPSLHRALARLRSSADEDLRSLLAPLTDDAYALVDGSTDG